MEHSIMGRFLWNGLDLEKYEVRKIIPQNETDAVVIMQSTCHLTDTGVWNTVEADIISAPSQN